MKKVSAIFDPVVGDGVIVYGTGAGVVRRYDPIQAVALIEFDDGSKDRYKIVGGKTDMGMTLKEFEKVDTVRGTGLICPRRSCGSKFIVNYKQVLDKKLNYKHPVKTIICPCCSKVSAIPAEDLAERGHDPCRQTDGYLGA